MAKTGGKGEAPPTIGIDYGTSTTQVSYLPIGDHPDLYRVGQGTGYDVFSIRSLIAVDPRTQDVRIGADARALRSPWIVLPSLKRCLRCTLDKTTGKGSCTNPPNQPLCLGLGRYSIGERVWSVGDLIGAFMGAVAKRTPVSDVGELHFSVPPMYDAAEIAVVRKAAADVFRPATVADVRYEPTSALVTISQDKQLPNGIHVVIDVGGGTTDVATLELRDRYFEIHEPRSTMIAGDDFDNELFKHFRPLVSAAEATDYDLREACRDAKEQLSAYPETQVVKRPLTQQQFEEIILSVVWRLVTFVASYARERLEEFAKVRHVRTLYFHPVGGASRIPLIRKLLGSQEFAETRVRVEAVVGSGVGDVYKEHLAVFCVALGSVLEQADINLSSLPYALKLYDGRQLIRTIEANERFPVRFAVTYEKELRVVAERGAERLDVVKLAEPTVPPFQKAIGGVRGQRVLALRDLLSAGKGATFHLTSGGLMLVQGIRKERWYEAPWKNEVDEEKRRERARNERRRLGLL